MNGYKVQLSDTENECLSEIKKKYSPTDLDNKVNARVSMILALKQNHNYLSEN